MKSRPTVMTIKVLIDQRVELERKLASGPWDDWDGELLIEMLDLVKRRINAALQAATPDRSRGDGPCPMCHEVSSSFPALRLGSGQ